MYFYKTLIQYDGTERLGFQWQEGSPTIQGDLDVALQKIFTGKFSTRAASRTDKGVHAIAQVVKISAEDETPLELATFNAALPPHMTCLEISTCPAEFIPSMDQVSKEYRYLFTNQSDEQRYIANTPNPLNIEGMQTCLEMLSGTHDFRNFWSIGGVSSTTERLILECDLTMINPQEFFKNTLFTAGPVTSCWQFRIVGTGFLKHMVRHLVGALWLVGEGKLSVDAFSQLLHGEQKQQRPWKKADPRGLYLLKVSY